MSLDTIGPTRRGSPELLGGVDGAVQELQVGRGGVRLAADVVRRGRVGGDGGQRRDQVADLEIGLEPAAGADAEDLPDAELDELLDHDRGRGAAHAAGLHGDRLAVEGAGVPEHPALRVALHGVVEEGLGDVFRAQRVAGKEAGVGVVAGFGTDVDRQAAEPTASSSAVQDAHRAASPTDRARARADPGLLRRGSRRAGLPRGRRAARRSGVSRQSRTGGTA